jgi:ectoine hydroxylase-related dioxygenase (phytanoyl-CoA dioxygenase family)
MNSTTMPEQNPTKNQTDFSSLNGAMVNEQTPPAQSEVEERIEEIRIRGYTLIENVYMPDELKYAKEKISSIYSQQIEALGGEENMSGAGDLNIARQLLVYDDFFLKKARHPLVMEIVRIMLGDYFILYQQNGNIHQPNVENTTAPWHRDLTFYHYTSSRPLAMSCLHLITESNELTGGTPMLPGSHKIDALPTYKYLEKNQVLIPAPAGSIWLFDSMMFHRSGFNSSNETRYSINHMYTLHLMTQQISLPRMLNGRWKDDESLRGFMGYNCMQQDSVENWRLEKINNPRKSVKF